MTGHTENTVLIQAPLEMCGRDQRRGQLAAAVQRVRRRRDPEQEAGHYVSSGSPCTRTTRPGLELGVRADPDPDDHGVTARRVETGPFEYMDIRWDYRAVPTRSRCGGCRTSHMKPAAPVDDAAMTERINTHTPIQMARIKQLIESGAAEQGGTHDRHRPRNRAASRRPNGVAAGIMLSTVVGIVPMMLVQPYRGYVQHGPVPVAAVRPADADLNGPRWSSAPSRRSPPATCPPGRCLSSPPGCCWSRWSSHLRTFR